MKTNQNVERFGDLDWKGALDPQGWRMLVLADNADPGNPVPIEKTLAHQMMDGAVKEVTGHENIVITRDVEITAKDSRALNLGVKALALACANPSTFLVSPPDGMGALTRFNVVTANPKVQFQNSDWVRNRLVYRVEIECEPFGRSVESVTDSVEPVEDPAGDEQINACDATTGFTALGGFSASVDTSVKYEGTGSLKLDGPHERWQVSSGQTAYVKFSGGVELSGLSLTDPENRPFISFKAYAKDLRTLPNALSAATLWVNGVEATLVSSTRLDASWMLYTFRTDVAETIETLRIDQTIIANTFYPWTNGADQLPPTLPDSWRIHVDDIRRSGFGTTNTRQAVRATPVRGSARTQASLHLWHPTNGLGKVMLLSTPALKTGYAPNLMKWCTSTTSVDSTSMSGLTADLSSPVDFEFPAAMVQPGSFQVWGFMEAGASTQVEIDMATKSGSTTLSSDTHEQRIKGAGTSTPAFVDCGQITLPTSRVPVGSAATVTLTLEVGSGGDLQELFLIPLVDGTAVNIIDCGDIGTAAVGSANSHLWVDSADGESRFPSVWLGTEADRSDAYHAGDAEAVRWQPLSLTPPEVLLFVANSGGASPSVTITHSPAWHGLAAE